MAELEQRYYDFTEDELAYMEATKLEWQAANRKDRHSIATRVYKKFIQDNPDWDKKARDLKKRVSV